ncbi:MAG: sigma-70 family RNA polymerase sigma factor [Planctomycetota bacterium]|nr:sigma-70 family RNA polymerase sigma factor [Planctomycetota bacterium]
MTPIDEQEGRQPAPEGDDRRGLSDEALMAGVRRGERLAFEALYSRYGSPVMRFLYRLSGDRVLAEDLTQDTFLKVWRAAPRWRPIGRVSTWLFQIAKRHWWNEGAKRRRRRGISLPDDDQSARTPTKDVGPEAHAARADLARAVREAVAALPRRLRLVFVLVRLEGLALAEAAQVAGIPVGTVKSRLAAAEKQLARRLGPRLG